jgi:hypothetical protein
MVWLERPGYAQSPPASNNLLNCLCDNELITLNCSTLKTFKFTGIIAFENCLLNSVRPIGHKVLLDLHNSVGNCRKMALLFFAGEMCNS